MWQAPAGRCQLVAIYNLHSLSRRFGRTSSIFLKINFEQGVFEGSANFLRLLGHCANESLGHWATG